MRLQHLHLTDLAFLSIA